MKKRLLLLLFCLPLMLSAQVVTEDFDAFTIGSFDTQWDPASWTGWFGGASGCNISDAYANSGTNSMEVAQDNDIVALLGVLAAGSAEISFMQYIPAGNGAYFNLQHNYTNTAGDWAAEFYFSDEVTGTGRVTTDGVPTDFTGIQHDAWVEHKVIIDFSTMIAEYSYNGTLTHAWSLNTNASGGPGLNQLNGINFYGACLDGGTGCTSLAYYDDINIVYTPPQYDLALLEFSSPSEYSIVPMGLESDLTLEADVSNVGGSDVTNVSVTFEILDAGGVVYTETSAALPTLAAGSNSTFVAPVPYAPSASGNYTVNYTVNLDETDSDLNNNTLSTSFPYSVDDTPLYDYARDDGNYTNGLGVTGGTAILGSNFDFSIPAYVTSINTSLVGGAVGDTIVAHIFSTNADGSPNAIIASTDLTIISTAGGGIGSEVYYTIDFPTPEYLLAGDYVFAVEQISATSYGLSTADNIFTPNSGWATTDGGANWSSMEGIGFPLALHIRPLIDFVVSIEEPVGYINALSIAPNPTSGQFMLDIELSEAKNLAVEIYNAQGQLVNIHTFGNTPGGQYEMDLTRMSSGIYFVKCLVGEQVLTQRVVVSR